jgi:hypothetical protein
MSAFVVGHDHIDALMTFAASTKTSYYFNKKWVEITRENCEEVGRILLDANVQSVSYRYDDADETNLPGTIGETAAGYRFRPFASHFQAVQIIKACHCLNYQSCERPDWYGSLAETILQAIKSAAEHKLPGYSDAQWDISRPSVKAAA